MKKFFLIFIGVVAAIAVVACIGSFFYWQYLKTTPQYTLALLADSARRDDKAAIGDLVDTDAVVDGMLPQVIDKAIEMYARGLPVATIAKAAIAASPLMPQVKERARAELPNLIRSEAERVGDTPFPLMVLGAKRYLDIQVGDDAAIVRSKDPDHPTEIIMKRVGNRWRIVGVRDEELAADIAGRIGQEIMAMLTNAGPNGTGMQGVDSLLRQLQRAIQ